MTSEEVLEEFRSAGALLQGHFILSSGLRSPTFLQKMTIFSDPARTERLCRALAETIAATRQTAEGVKSCESVLDLARRSGVDMPIVEAVVDVVHNGRPTQEALQALMSRSAKAERR